MESSTRAEQILEAARLAQLKAMYDKVKTRLSREDNRKIQVAMRVGTAAAITSALLVLVPYLEAAGFRAHVGGVKNILAFGKEMGWLGR